MKRRAMLVGVAAGLSGCSLLGSDDEPRTELRNESPSEHDVTMLVRQNEALSTTIDSGEIQWHDNSFFLGDVATRDLSVKVLVDGTTAFDQVQTVGYWVKRFTVTVEGPETVTVETFPPRTPYDEVPEQPETETESTTDQSSPSSSTRTPGST